MRKLLLRALGIWTLKTVVYAAFFIVSMLFFLGTVSSAVLSLIHGAMLFLFAFLFSEWIFYRTSASPRQLILVIVATFLWDTVLFAAFSMWMLGPYRYAAPWTQNVLFFVIHTAAVSLAWYAKKHFPRHGGIEGLA